MLFPVAAQAESAHPALRCGSSDGRVARKWAELPAEVRRALPERMADPGEPFRKGDVIAPGEEDVPGMRLICGYPTHDGYVVRRERGGRFHEVGDMKFRKTPSGYVAD